MARARKPRIEDRNRREAARAEAIGLPAISRADALQQQVLRAQRHRPHLEAVLAFAAHACAWAARAHSLMKHVKAETAGPTHQPESRPNGELRRSPGMPSLDALSRPIPLTNLTD